jgi:hypothetical protein
LHAGVGEGDYITTTLVAAVKMQDLSVFNPLAKGRKPGRHLRVA